MHIETIYVLAVVVLTWGAVFGYLLRLDKLTRDLDKKITARENAQSQEL